MFGQKRSKIKHKTITISILKPISCWTSKEEFIKILENNIYQNLDLLN
jgi:1-acyl-sn-glycerol-3-phosphate acyltransferase